MTAAEMTALWNQSAQDTGNGGLAQATDSSTALPDYSTNGGKRSNQSAHLEGLWGENFSSDQIMGQMVGIFDHLTKDQQQAMMATIFDRAQQLEQRTWDKSESELSFTRQSAAYQLMQMQAAGIGRDAAISAYSGQQYNCATGAGPQATQQPSTTPTSNALGALAQSQAGIKNMQDFAHGVASQYETYFTMAGDALVQPVIEEVFSWITKHEGDPNYKVSDQAKRSPECLKYWCLEKDPVTGEYLRPDAVAMIKSDYWLKMRTSPAGITAFQRYFKNVMDGKTPHLNERDADITRAEKELDYRSKQLNVVRQQFAAMHDKIGIVTEQLKTGINTDIGGFGFDFTNARQHVVGDDFGNGDGPALEVSSTYCDVNAMSFDYVMRNLSEDNQRAILQKWGPLSVFFVQDENGQWEVDDEKLSTYLDLTLDQIQLDLDNTSFAMDVLPKQKEAMMANLNAQIAMACLESIQANGTLRAMKGMSEKFYRCAATFKALGVTPFKATIEDPMDTAMRPLDTWAKIMSAVGSIIPG